MCVDMQLVTAKNSTNCNLYIFFCNVLGMEIIQTFAIQTLDHGLSFIFLLLQSRAKDEKLHKHKAKQQQKKKHS